LSSKSKQRLVGLFILLVAVGMFIYNWHSALTEGVYWGKASIAFPFFAFLGIAIFLFPVTKEECLAQHGTEQLSWSVMPVPQKILILIGAIAGIINWAFITGRI
jgi:hypothetical protein